MSFLSRRRLDPKYLAGLVFLVAANFVRYLSPRMGIDDSDMFPGALMGLAIGLLLWFSRNITSMLLATSRPQVVAFIAN
jgi:hypothetical protein